MGRHAAPGHEPAPRSARVRPGSGLLGWGAFTAVVTAGALLVYGVPVPTSVAVGLLGLVVFAVVWGATWRAGSTPARTPTDPRPPGRHAPGGHGDPDDDHRDDVSPGGGPGAPG